MLAARGAAVVKPRIAPRIASRLGYLLRVRQYLLGWVGVAGLGGSFVIGLHVDTLSGETSTDEGVRFSAQSEPEPNQLILTVQ